MCANGEIDLNTELTAFTYRFTHSEPATFEPRNVLTEIHMHGFLIDLSARKGLFKHLKEKNQYELDGLKVVDAVQATDIGRTFNQIIPGYRISQDVSTGPINASIQSLQVFLR